MHVGADVFATLMTLFFAVRIHKEIGHKSHLTAENLAMLNHKRYDYAETYSNGRI